MIEDSDTPRDPTTALARALSQAGWHLALFCGDDDYELWDGTPVDLQSAARTIAESAYALGRAAMLIDGERSVCERRTAERDEALAITRQLATEAAYGRAFLGMLATLGRLRRSSCSTMAFGFSADETEQVVAAELAEVMAEHEGSDRAKAECVDVLAASVHLGVAHGMRPADLLAGMQAWTDRIARRLDHVDAGGTWSEAKAAEKSR
jgi:hypothetical protein